MATWLQVKEIKVQLDFLKKYGEDFWCKEAAWTEKEDSIYCFPPGYKSSQMPHRCLARSTELQMLILKSGTSNAAVVESLSSEKQNEYQKRFVEFYKAGLSVHHRYSKKWFENPLVFGTIANPSEFRCIAAALLLAYCSVKTDHSLFFHCIRPATEYLVQGKDTSVPLLGCCPAKRVACLNDF